MHASHNGNLTAIIPFWKQRSLWLIKLFAIKYSDDKVATEQLSAVVGVQVDFTFMQHDDPEIS